MADEIKSNLEPIEENDLNLENKFVRSGAETKKVEGADMPKDIPEIVSAQEMPERKEGAMEKDSAYSRILAKIKSPSTAIHSDVSNDAKATSEETDYESKIVKLVEIAETKGVAHAVKVAQHLEDNYTLDELHDRLLAEDLHNALVKKGMIREF
ncbi:MAG TPA: hypothetical protein DCS28_04150 [Candidatus Moranbacteria bacterium]|nr:hypothetical protein [Candidatus Moranbacteria bacterium]HAT75201.1 hypothetical protein [Candidatus Moranbacteria bacterium]